jgi:hypothetical protein
MSRIDWSKAGATYADPARVTANAREFDVFVPTAEGRKEFALAKKARSKSAKQSAATRKANREHETKVRLQAQADDVAKREREEILYLQLQAKLNKRNELRNLEKQNSKPAASSLGVLLKDAFDKFPKL